MRRTNPVFTERQKSLNTGFQPADLCEHICISDLFSRFSQLHILIQFQTTVKEIKRK